jgi:murein DD-endopeptidase MepM/ murein hydrolase activator NlpD
MSLDYAAILSAGQSLVPNMREEALKQQQQDLQQQEIKQRTAEYTAKVAEAQRNQQRETQFHDALNQVHIGGGKPRDVQMLMLQFPEYAEKIKPAWEAMDKDQRTTNLTQLGSIYARAQAGDYAQAAAILRPRVEADDASGNSDPRDKAILTALESGSDIEKRAAAAEVGVHIAAADPDKFGETYGKLNPADKTSAFANEYQDRVRLFGKPAADAWTQTQDTKMIAAQDGQHIFTLGGGTTGSGAAPQPKGGDPNSGGVVAPTVPPAAIQAASASGDWSSVLTDPLHGAGGPPVHGGKYGASRDYGAHNATDYTGPEGTPVFSGAGTGIAHVSKSPKGGNIVTVNHGNGLVTKYMHLDSVGVQNGQQVDASTPLGTLGKTGRATGPNLHYQVLANGKPVDPSRLGSIRIVRSVQEANKLPKGTVFRTPDGRTLRVP